MDTQKAQEWLNDPKNRPVVIVGAIIFFVIGAFACFKLYGPKSTGPLPTAGQVPATAAKAAPAPGTPGATTPTTAPAPGAAPAVGAKVGAPGTPAAAAPGAPGAAAPGVAAASAASATGPMLPYRKDPFAVSFRIPKPTPKSVIRAALSALPPYSISTDPVPVVNTALANAAANEVQPEQPFRRMSGVMMDGSVSAVLETRSDTGTDSDVVVPGMEINRGHSKVRVERITSSEMILKTLDTKTPMTIRVNLAGSTTLPSGQSSSTKSLSPIQ
jgi:hypothetical protein